MSTWDYMTDMWFSCNQVEVDWSFPNGTLVSAHSYEEALNAIKNYRLSRNNARAHQTDRDRWTVQFDRNIYITISAKTRDEAIRRASWQFYMDKRETV